MTFNDFLRKHKLKNTATSIVEINRVFLSLGLTEVGIYLRDRPFNTDIGMLNLQPSEGTHWVCYINAIYFDSFGCVCPKKLSKFVIKQNGYCLCSEHQIQKKIVFVQVIVYI